MDTCLWLWGAFGAIAAEAAFVYQQRTKRPSARDFMGGFFFFATSLMVVVTGGVVYLYETHGMISHGVAAFHVGAATPAVLGKIVLASPSAPTTD